MAVLNLGSAKLSIEAETRLGRAKAEMQAMSKAMINVSRRAKTMGKDTKTSAVVQQSALAKVRERIINLQHAYELAGQKGSASFLKISQAGNVFAQSMSKAGQSQDKFRDSSIRLNRSLGVLKRELTEIKKKGAAASGSMGKMTERLKNLGSASVLAVGPLSGFGARVAALGAIVGRTNLKMAIMFGAMAGGVFAVGKLTFAIVRNGLEIERLRARLTVATGSVNKANVEFTFMKKIAREMGSPLLASAKGYGLLAAAADAAGLKLEDTRKIYKALSAASVALKLENQEVTGIFRAFQQMLSKGNVQAEELRGQLGERLPGALNLAAQALGVTTSELSKMLEDGEVLAVDLLPKLADVMLNKFAGQGLTGLQTEMNKANTEWSLFLDNADKFLGVSTVLAGSLSVLTKFLRAHNEELEVGVDSMPGFFESYLRFMERTSLVGDQAFGALADHLREIRIESALLADQGGMDFPSESYSQNLTKVNKLNNDFISSMRTVGKAIRESVLTPTEEWQEAVWEAGRALAAGQISLDIYQRKLIALNIELDTNLGLMAQSVPIIDIAMQAYGKLGAKLEELGDTSKGFGVDMRQANDHTAENLTHLKDIALQAYGPNGLGRIPDVSKEYARSMRLMALETANVTQEYGDFQGALSQVQASIGKVEDRTDNLMGTMLLLRGEPLQGYREMNQAIQDVLVSLQTGTDRIQAYGEASGLLSQIIVENAERFKEQEKALKETSQTYDRFSRIVSGGLASAIVNADNLSDAFANIAKRIAEAALEMAIFNALSGIYVGGGGGQGAGTSASPTQVQPVGGFGGTTGLLAPPSSGGDTNLFVDVGDIDATGSSLTAAEVEDAVRNGVNSAVSQAVVTMRQMELRNQ